MRSHDQGVAAPIGPGEVSVRLAGTGEFAKWDRLMRRHHRLGFRRFAGRGLRYICEGRGRWLALSGWQTGALKMADRDRWIGWRPEQHYSRLHLVACNTRFAMLAEPGSCPNLASHVLSRITRRISRDWEEAYGHGLLLAETFIDPAVHRGTMYEAAGWQAVGETAGYSRRGGRYTPAHGQCRRILVRPLRRDARRILCGEGGLPVQWHRRGAVSRFSELELSSLHAEFVRMRDFRRGQGRKHGLASAFTMLILARLSKFEGGRAAAQFAAALSQQELKAVGAWYDRRAGRHVPPSKSTLYRVIQYTDPEQLQEVLRRHTRRHIRHLAAVAGDGKRIRGANRNGDSHYETVTLVEHGTGNPRASVTVHNPGEEIDAIRRPVAEGEVAGRVITLDALHSTFETADLARQARAHYLLSVRENTPRQLDLLRSLPWSSTRVRRHSEDMDKDHGRIEQRHIAALEVDGPNRFGFRDVRQAFRIDRDREVSGDPESAGTETVYGLTSVPAEQADARQLPEWNRGHWIVESNHHIRDRTFGEDACLTRTSNGPANRATCNNLALALIFRQNRFDSVPQALRHFTLHRQESLDAVLNPPQARAASAPPVAALACHRPLCDDRLRGRAGRHGKRTVSAAGTPVPLVSARREGCAAQ